MSVAIPVLGSLVGVCLLVIATFLYCTFSRRSKKGKHSILQIIHPIILYSGFVFTNPSQKQSLSIFPKFLKFENKKLFCFQMSLNLEKSGEQDQERSQEWILPLNLEISGEHKQEYSLEWILLTYVSKFTKFWRTIPRPFSRMDFAFICI